MLGRSQVTKLIKANVFAAEDFLKVVTQGYVVVAAMDVRQVSQLEEKSWLRERKYSKFFKPADRG